MAGKPLDEPLTYGIHRGNDSCSLRRTGLSFGASPTHFVGYATRCVVNVLYLLGKFKPYLALIRVVRHWPNSAMHCSKPWNRSSKRPSKPSRRSPILCSSCYVDCWATCAIACPSAIGGKFWSFRSSVETCVKAVSIVWKLGGARLAMVAIKVGKVKNG